MNPAFELTPELLQRHGRAVSGLARSLLGDAHAAEDVAQETWLAHLTFSGEAPQRLSAWLGTVARRLALRRLRGERRRRVREERRVLEEQGAATELVANGPVDDLEREEALRALTQALLALEEPFKSTLLLRYYEGRTPTQIAAQRGISLATVKSRLARGLERLRTRLAHEFEDEPRRTRALLVLAGVPRNLVPPVPAASSAAPSLVTAIGTLLMGMKLEAGVALVVLSLAALWWRSEARSAAPEDSAARMASVAGPGALPASSGEPMGAADEGARIAVDPAPAPGESEDSPPVAEFHFQIDGRVRDELGMPVSGARVFLGPRAFPLNRVAETDDEGRFALTFEGRRPSLDCAFTVEVEGVAWLGLRELPLVAGRPARIDVGLDGVAPARKENVAKDVLTTIGSRIEARGDSDRLSLVFSAHLVSSLPALEKAPEMDTARDGHRIFVDPPPEGACTRPAEPRLPLLDYLEASSFEPVQISGFAVSSVASSEYSLAVSVTNEFPGPPGTVRGEVRDALGAPQPGIVVGWSPPGRKLGAHVLTDEAGAFLLEVPEGEYELHALGGKLGRASTRLDVVSAQESGWNPVLLRGDEVTGRILLRDRALAKARVELWSVSPEFVWSAARSTDEDGRFVFPEVPGGALELHVYASGSSDEGSNDPPSQFPVRVLGPVYARSDVGDVVLDVPDTVTHRIRLALENEAGEPVAGAELRLWQPTTGRGVFGQVTRDSEGALVVKGLPKGSYRVEAGGALGWRDLGSVWVEDDMDLGVERFPPAGVAVLRAEHPDGDGPTPFSASLWSLHPDVFGRVARLEELDEVLQPVRAGDYLLLAGSGRRERCETPLRVLAGTSSGLTLALGAGGRLETRADAGPFALRGTTIEPSLLVEDCVSCHGPASR